MFHMNELLLYALKISCHFTSATAGKDIFFAILYMNMVNFITHPFGGNYEFPFVYVRCI